MTMERSKRSMPVPRRRLMHNLLRASTLFGCWISLRGCLYGRGKLWVLQWYGAKRLDRFYGVSRALAFRFDLLFSWQVICVEVMQYS